jgi:hypothetical protein
MKPGDFPIGSTESRAAARAMLKSRMKGRPTVKMLGRYVGKDESALIIGPWQSSNNGGFWRGLQVPRGSSKEAINRFLDTVGTFAT